MLDDAAIERWSRQILLPEVGGRGQERLCATEATVSGTGDAAALASVLLAAAGVRVRRADAAAGRVSVTCGDGTVLGRGHGAAAAVVTLVGRPCPRCVPDHVWPAAATGAADDAPVTQAFGALVAGEALRLALGLATGARLQAFDLATGTFEGRPIPASDGCAACVAAT